MKITNQEEIKKAIAREMGDRLGNAVEATIYNIVEELPNGHGSKIADEIIMKKVSETEYEVYASYVWTLLNDGTGIYGGGKHAGKGPGGEIIPINAKVLHFKNKELASALGFPTEDVFLAKVKGITPRYYWDRNFTPGHIRELMAITARA